MNSQMHAHCAVPITPERPQAPGRRAPLHGVDGAAIASEMSFQFEGCMARDDRSRWSARRTLTFVFVSNAVLWWVIAQALRSLA